MTLNLRVKKRNIDDKAIDGNKVLFLNEHAFKAKKTDGSEQELFKLNSSNVFQLGLLPRSSFEPIHEHDVSNKAYVDTQSNIIRVEFGSATAQAEQSAKTYADQKISAETSERMASEQSILSLIEAESSARQNADSSILSELSTEATTRQLADAQILSEAKAYADSATTGITTQAQSYTDAKISESEASASILMAQKLEEAKAYTDSEVTSESLARASEDARILSEANQYTDTQVIGEAALRSSEDARILSEAESYADLAITSQITNKLGQPSGIATLNSFGKLPVSQLPGIALTDVYVVTTIAERDALAVEEGDVAKVTQAIQSSDGSWLSRTYIYAVDNATQVGTWLDIVTESDVDSVNGKTGIVVLNTDDIAEGVTNKYFTEARAYQVVDTLADQFKLERKILTAQDILNNYIELDFKAYPQSIAPVIDRLALIEEYDYFVSVVGEKTRLTFTGSLLQGGDEALSEGDRLSVRYLRDMRPRV